MPSVGSWLGWLVIQHGTSHQPALKHVGNKCFIEHKECFNYSIKHTLSNVCFIEKALLAWKVCFMAAKHTFSFDLAHANFYNLMCTTLPGLSYKFSVKKYEYDLILIHSSFTVKRSRAYKNVFGTHILYIALGFASCYITILVARLVLYYTYSTRGNTSTYT